MVERSRIVDVHGNPIPLSTIKTPQTSQMSQLHREWQGHPARGLTPSRVARIMLDAERGNPLAQFELYEDMEERDPHIMSEMGKRRRAVGGLEWTLNEPPNPWARERKNTVVLKDLLRNLDDFEDVLFDITDAIGKGFSCLEMEWHRVAGYWLPKSVVHRPQTWFEFERGYQQELVLRNHGGNEPLQPFGWIVHKHKAKSGWLERSALFRVLVWPYLFKNYSVGDLAEFLEIYGIPLRVGKYASGANENEKRTLLRALSCIGHNAAGIIPQGMEIEFHNAVTGDPAAFDSMISWCEKSQSKAILGGTLTSQADGQSSTNALGNVHNEVRKELRDSDAKQIAKSLSRDLVYPLAVLNGLADGWERCPRLQFDLNEPEDMEALAGALPTFIDMGFRISRQWAQERAGIPEPESDEDVLTRAQAAPTPMPEAALNQQISPPPQTLTEQLDNRLQRSTDQWIDAVRALVNRVESLEQLRDELAALIPDMSLEQYADMMAEALRLAELAGRDDLMSEAVDAS